jgi:hypothetical protein
MRKALYRLPVKLGCVTLTDYRAGPLQATFRQSDEEVKSVTWAVKWLTGGS